MQRADGGWHCYSYASPYYATRLFSELLSALGPEYDPALERTLRCGYDWRAQLRDTPSLRDGLRAARDAASFARSRVMHARPVVKDGQVVVQDRMKVTMSCDHRVIDGAAGAEYLRTLRQYLEQPLRLFI